MRLHFIHRWAMSKLNETHVYKMKPPKIGTLDDVKFVLRICYAHNSVMFTLCNMVVT